MFKTQNSKIIFIAFYFFSSLTYFFYFSQFFSYGDVSRYLNSEDSQIYNSFSTAFTINYFSFWVSILSSYGLFFSNLLFTTFLLFKLLHKLPGSLMLIFLIPGVALWVSTPSKESLIFQATAVLILLRQHDPYHLIKIIFFYFLYEYKPHLAVVAIPFIIMMHLTDGGKRDVMILFINITFLFFALLGYFNFLHPYIDNLLNIIGYHFDYYANTGVNDPIVGQYSFFQNIPEGLYRTWFIVYPNELGKYGFYVNYVFFESIIILVLIFYIFFKYFNKASVSQKIIILLFLVSISVAVYPFMIYNLGSAWRYKVSFLTFIVLAFYFFNQTNEGKTSTE